MEHEPAAGANDADRAASIADAERRLLDIAARYFTGDYLQRDGATLVAAAIECITYLGALRRGEKYVGPLLMSHSAVVNAAAVPDALTPAPAPNASAYEEHWEPLADPDLERPV
jgi:hypothetical protein